MICPHCSNVFEPNMKKKDSSEPIYIRDGVFIGTVIIYRCPKCRKEVLSTVLIDHTIKLPPKNEKMPTWRVFLGKQCECLNCKHKFRLSTKYEDRIKKEDVYIPGTNDERIRVEITLVLCPNCGCPIPLSDYPINR